MGAVVNVFKSVFGGILGFFGGLFAGNKGGAGKKGADGFYMEATADQLEALPDAPAAAKKAAKGTQAVAMNAAPAKASKPAANMSPEDLIAAALAAVAKAPEGSAEAMIEKTATLGFAEQNMIPTLTSGRRTPGPSLAGFKSMAKEIRA
jgi:hypothetical protein